MNYPLPSQMKPWRYLSIFDYFFSLVVFISGGEALLRYHIYMDFYEQILLIIATLIFILLGLHWKRIRLLMIGIALTSAISIGLYHNDLESIDRDFLLKYMFSSQSAILWMSILFMLSSFFYWIGFLSREENFGSLGTYLCWVAAWFGFTGIIMRWYESYMISKEIGHIPLSNLYEVLILFCLITSILCLYYEEFYETKALYPFVSLVVISALIFLIRYSIKRPDVQQIQPLLPALQSWWMKIHVPANFIGYGCFAISSMSACVYLLRFNGHFIDRIPSLETLDDMMYNTVMLGFVFFTIAIALGAMWASESWGSYWSWDPKETWALIVWLNYAAWLHMRLLNGIRRAILAWWALISLPIVTFAFLGVNIFLSGLHSYGQL